MERNGIASDDTILRIDRLYLLLGGISTVEGEP